MSTEDLVDWLLQRKQIAPAGSIGGARDRFETLCRYLGYSVLADNDVEDFIKNLPTSTFFSKALDLLCTSDT